MARGAPPEGYEQLAIVIDRVVDEALRIAPEIRLLFVTNLREGPTVDIGPDGVLNSAQYYTQAQADLMIRSFQGIGLNVEPSFSERELINALMSEEGSTDPRQRVVYTTAEGGTGSGRRALIPALCNLVSIPALNSGAHASSLVRHKFHAYAVLREVGVRVPQTWQIGDWGWSAGQTPPLGARVILKPTYESMGIGVDDESVRIVKDDFDEFARAAVRRFGQPAVVQEFITGEEVGVSVARIGSTYALPPIAQRRANGQSYEGMAKTFRNEHVDHDVSHLEFEGPAEQVTALRDAAVRTFDSLEMRGVGRIDFRIDSDGRAWVFDTNGEPPPMRETCWAVAMEKLGFEFEDLLALWLGICLLDHGLIQESAQNESSQHGNNRP